MRYARSASWLLGRASTKSDTRSVHVSCARVCRRRRRRRRQRRRCATDISDCRVSASPFQLPIAPMPVLNIILNSTTTYKIQSRQFPNHSSVRFTHHFHKKFLFIQLHVNMYQLLLIFSFIRGYLIRDSIARRIRYHK